MSDIHQDALTAQYGSLLALNEKRELPLFGWPSISEFKQLTPEEQEDVVRVLKFVVRSPS